MSPALQTPRACCHCGEPLPETAQRNHRYHLQCRRAASRALQRFWKVRHFEENRRKGRDWYARNKERAVHTAIRALARKADYISTPAADPCLDCVEWFEQTTTGPRWTDLSDPGPAEVILSYHQCDVWHLPGGEGIPWGEIQALCPQE
jgi:hypothetical protein